MDTIAHALKVTGSAAIDGQRFVAAAKEMTDKSVPTVEAHGVGAQKPFHARHQVGAGRFEDQVKVVAHETPCVDLPVGFLASLPEGLQKQLAVFVGAEDRLAMVAAVHDVINGPRILDSELSSHVSSMSAERMLSMSN